MMSYIISGMILLAILTGGIGGNMAAVSTAAMNGCGQAVQLVISLTGTICLWSGVMRVADRSGLTDAMSRMFRPITRFLFRELSEESPAMKAISMNMAANLLGLGNAATPLGLEAARLMAERTPGVASDGLCMLVVTNTASLQLIPTTVASLRAAAGSANPFDILPAVWLASVVSVAVGITAAKLFARLWR